MQIKRIATKAYWKKNNSIAVLEPAITTRNSGDNIIAQASMAEIHSLFPDHFYTTIPTHEKISWRSWRIVNQSQHTILAGSNVLTRNMVFDRGWRLSPIDAMFISDIITLAAGWRSYGKDRSPVGTQVLRRALKTDGIHSVRDEFSKERLLDAGVKNVVNTACVTMWRLDLDAIAALPQTMGKSVISTVNVGERSPEDQYMVDLLCKLYEKVYLWPQGIYDLDYCRELSQNRCEVIGQSLESYDEILRTVPDLDYVGSRLHGGIRALQHNVRTLVIAIDNRATEIGRDTNLPVLDRAAVIEELERRIINPQKIEIKLPTSEIEKWRTQFRAVSTRSDSVGIPFAAAL
jgi:hypothetical protein